MGDSGCSCFYIWKFSPQNFRGSAGVVIDTIYLLTFYIPRSATTLSLPAWYCIGPSHATTPAPTCQDMDRDSLPVVSGAGTVAEDALCLLWWCLCFVHGSVKSQKCSVGFGELLIWCFGRWLGLQTATVFWDSASLFFTTRCMCATCKFSDIIFNLLIFAGIHQCVSACWREGGNGSD